MSINYEKQEEEILALSYSLKLLKAGFTELPTISGISYTDGIPLVVRELLISQIDFRDTQIRIREISKNTGLSIANIRSLMKNGKALCELEAFKLVGGKVIIEDTIKIVKDL